MAHVRILYYLLNFYLFSASATLSYLSVRAWLDPGLHRRKREDPFRVPRLSHVVRTLALLLIASAAMVGAVREGANGLGFNLVAVCRIAGYVILLGSLFPTFKFDRASWVGAAFIAVGEALLVGHTVRTEETIRTLTLRQVAPFIGLLFSNIGIGIIGLRMARTILRIRLADRLLISFAIYGLLLTQVVALLVFGIISSLALSTNDLLAVSERPLLIILTGVLMLSALIGFFIARDLTAPVNKLHAALREIGDGKINQRVEIKSSAFDDELSDLAREVNRMSVSLESAEEMRADFFSFVSHELKSPLTSIQGFVTTLRSVDGFTAIERDEMYGIIQDETDRLLRMINELLDLSRIQAGKPLKLNSEWFDVGRQLGKVANIMRGDAHKHRIDLVVPDAPVWIYADPDKIMQIVINLMSNAVKYSPSGGVVTLRLVFDNVRAIISVSDQGVGMTQEQCARVFDKFYRVSENDREAAKRLRRVEGAGIGLYLTRSLVEAHEGTIEVESEPGKGSVFTVSLPRGAGEHPGLLSEAGKDRPMQIGGTLLTNIERESVPHIGIAPPVAAIGLSTESEEAHSSDQSRSELIEI